MRVVVIAQEEELKLVKDLGYNDLPIIITGVGGVNVINALKDLPRNTEILNIGYCGSNNIPIGTQVVPYSVTTFHEKARFVEFNYVLAGNKENANFTRCYTSTDFVTQTNIKNSCIFDMELAFIRAMFDNVRAIKVVSDNLNKKEYYKTIKGI